MIAPGEQQQSAYEFISNFDDELKDLLNAETERSQFLASVILIEREYRIKKARRFQHWVGIIAIRNKWQTHKNGISAPTVNPPFMLTEAKGILVLDDKKITIPYSHLDETKTVLGQGNIEDYIWGSDSISQRSTYSGVGEMPVSMMANSLDTMVAEALQVGYQII